MVHDQHAEAEGDRPYDVLSDAGVSPASSMKEVLDASFDLMRGDRWTPEVRAAWNTLRMVESRLVADFLYRDAADREPGHTLRLLAGGAAPADLEYDR